MKLRNNGTSVFSFRDKDRNLFEVRPGESADVPAGLADNERIKAAVRNGRLGEDTGTRQQPQRTRRNEPRTE